VEGVGKLDGRVRPTGPSLPPPDRRRDMTEVQLHSRLGGAVRLNKPLRAFMVTRVKVTHAAILTQVRVR
jgi:hypothetical protein